MTVASYNSMGFVNTTVGQLPVESQTDHAMPQYNGYHGSGMTACHQNPCTEIIDLVSDDEFEEKPNVGGSNSLT